MGVVRLLVPQHAGPGPVPPDPDDHPPRRGRGRHRPLRWRSVVRRLRSNGERRHDRDTCADRGHSWRTLARGRDPINRKRRVSAPALSERLGQPIRGPRALSDSWPRFWHLTYNIARSEFKLKFFGSALGYLWQVVRPLLLFGVLYVFFVLVFHVNQAKGAASHF